MRRSTASTAATNTTAWATTTSASCSTNCCPTWRPRRPRDGRPIRLSQQRQRSRHRRFVSSGAICAFTAAWERPEAFSRVFSAIGTYVGLRGGDRYPTLIRKFEPKPIRIFLQDGSNDNNIYGGDWWMANQTMERALTFAGYEVQHVWGEGGAQRPARRPRSSPMRCAGSGRTGRSRCKAGQTQNNTLGAILVPGEGWQLVAEGYKFTEGPAANAKGEVFFNDVPAQQDLPGRPRRQGGRLPRRLEDAPTGRRSAPMAGSTRSRRRREDRGVRRRRQGGGRRRAAFAGNDLVVAHNGNIYVTESRSQRRPTRARSGSSSPAARRRLWTAACATRTASRCHRIKLCST